VDGNAALESMIARMRGLEGFEAAVAREAAPLVEAAARQTAAAGTDPAGAAWAPKKSGGRALANAATKITAVPRGARVDIVLEGVEVYHQHGVEGGPPKRKIIPDVGDPVPPAIAAALHEGASRVFARTMGAR